MIITYIEMGYKRIQDSLDAWKFNEVYGQKCGYPEDLTSDGEYCVWSNDNNNLVMVF